MKEGAVALIYNYSVPSQEGVGRELSGLINRESGGTIKVWNYKPGIEKWTDEIEATGMFGKVLVRKYGWTQRYGSEAYIGLFRTYSEFLSLSSAKQSRVVDGITRILSDHGGFYDHVYESVLIHARLSKREEV